MLDALLTVCDVRKNYATNRGIFRRKGAIEALRGVTLQVAKGEVLGLVGESGCGKSTLARILTGLEEPSEGRVELCGENLNRTSKMKRTRRIQPIFQDPYSSLNPRRRVISQIALPLAAHGVGSRKEQFKRAEEFAELVGLPGRVLNGPPNELSGGQRQRVAIARALILRPEIVICDEPTSALDVSVQAQILNLLRKLQAEFQLTIIIISHDLSVVEYLSDRIAVMYAGRVVEMGETNSLFNDPLHPYTRTLLDSVLAPDPSLGIPELAYSEKGSFSGSLLRGCSFQPRCASALPVCKVEDPRTLEVSCRMVECHLHEVSK